MQEERRALELEAQRIAERANAEHQRPRQGLEIGDSEAKWPQPGSKPPRLPVMEPSLTSKLFAEFLGTFLLVFTVVPAERSIEKSSETPSVPSSLMNFEAF